MIQNIYYIKYEKNNKLSIIALYEISNIMCTNVPYNINY